jgi:cbb3-type cytochrome oxidase subunit 3
VIGLRAQAMTGVPIQLPRPNLGPEPMRKPAIGFATILGLAAAAIVLATLIAWAMRRRKRKRLDTSASGGLHDSNRLLSATPRVRLIFCAELLRRALVKRYGPRWAAKTTEEIVAEPELAALLGPERTEQLTCILRAGDRATFARDLGDADQGEDVEPLVRALIEALAPAAGATSTIKGK